MAANKTKPGQIEENVLKIYFRACFFALVPLGTGACSTGQVRPVECALEITSNLTKTTIFVDNKKIGEITKPDAKSLRVPIACDADHEVVARSPGGIKEKPTYLQPPYGNGQQLSFTWVYDEQDGYVPPQDSYLCTEQAPVLNKKGRTAKKRMKCVREWASKRFW